MTQAKRRKNQSKYQQDDSVRLEKGQKCLGDLEPGEVVQRVADPGTIKSVEVDKNNLAHVTFADGTEVIHPADFPVTVISE